MWPNLPTAIVVIHGMGQQDPFDTLDAFTSTLLRVMEREAGEQMPFSREHRLAKRDDWTENYISISPKSGPPVDVYEYYWAHETQREITGGEVFQWLVEIGEMARKYYKDNQRLADIYEQEGDEAFGKRFLFFGKSTFKKYWYLKYGGLLLRLTQGFLAVLDPVLGRFLPQAGKPLKVIGAIVGPFVGDKVANSFGDVVLYTTTSQKSRYYGVRQRILSGAVEEVQRLLEQKEPVEYGRIILVGHSLGSVIAYDTINRLNHAMNVKRILPGEAGRLRGLVTFGSPLDKVAFFLQPRAGERQHIKRQIQQNFHSFRAKSWNPGYIPPPTVALESCIESYLDGMVWLNFWDSKDPIAGKLDFYLVDYDLDSQGKKVEPGSGTNGFRGNRPLKMDHQTPWDAHTGYWDSQAMYRQILQEVVC